MRVMQVIDTLDAGGAEKIAVQLANLLPRDRVASYLCTTRREGPLEAEVAPHVVHERLHRSGRFDAWAIARFAARLKAEAIDVVHAHGGSLFIARVAAFLAGTPAVVWHDHYGRCELGDRPAWLYRAAVWNAGVIAVNQWLADWERTALRVPPGRVWYVPNWAAPRPTDVQTVTLPGDSGMRIVCVANFRAQKDHPTLLRAMVQVKAAVPGAHLLLVGSRTEWQYADKVLSQISELGLNETVTWLGARQDVSAVLDGCDIGVLSSASEGLPLALLEYGHAGLAAVATDVGQCREVLDDGRAGIVVPAGAPERLASALIGFLQSRERRAEYGERIRRRVATEYDAAAIMDRICAIYEGLLGRAQVARA